MPRYPAVFTRSMTRGLHHMSVTTPTASRRPSLLAAFQTAPTLVKLLVSILCGVGLLTLTQLVVLVAGGGFIVPQDQVAAVVSDLFVLVMVLILFLLGSGITRGY